MYYSWDAFKTLFLGTSTKLCGRWVGVSENIGPLMTIKIISDSPGEEICRYLVHPTDDPDTPNLREDPDPIMDINSDADCPSDEVGSVLDPIPQHYPTQSQT